MKTKSRIGLVGLLAVAFIGMSAPSVASAQERFVHAGYYAPVRVAYHDGWRERVITDN